MNITEKFDLQLFAEGASASGDAAGSTGDVAVTDTGAESDTAVTAKNRRKAKEDPYANVKFGIDPDAPEVGGDDDDVAEGNAEGDPAEADGEAEKAPRTYTEEEYKRGVEEAMKRRYKKYEAEAKKHEAQAKANESIYRYMSEHLNVDIDDIEGMAQAAETARKQRYQDEGMRTGNDPNVIEQNADNAYNVRNYKEQLNAIRETNEARAFNDRMAAQEKEVKSVYSDFDFDVEVKNNPVFRNLLRSGFTMMNAYESANHQKLLEAARTQAIREAEEKVSANVAANKSRPQEGGAVNPSAQNITDPGKLDPEMRKEIKRRVRRGEKIIW